MSWVIDTSALVRLFIPDGPISKEAEAAFNQAGAGGEPVLAPQLILVEVANVLLRKLRRDELSSAEHDELLNTILALPIRLIEHPPLIFAASRLAREFKLSAYDAIYLALAEEHGATLLTCDEYLATAARSLGL